MECIETDPGKDEGLFNDARKKLYDFPVPEDRIAAHCISAFVLMDNGEQVGRFALYQNPELYYSDKKCMCIGNYECIDSDAHARILLSKAIAIAKEKNVGYLIGPMNGSTWENYRFADSIRPGRFFMEPVNHPWYNKQFVDAGFIKIAQYYSGIDISLNYHRPGIEDRENELIQSGVTFRNIDMKNYEKELYKIYELSEQSFSKGFLFSPYSRENFIAKYLPLEKNIHPEHVILAEKSGKLMGYIFCMDDILFKSEKRLIIKTIARIPGKEAAGIGEILGKKIYEIAAAHDYKAIIHALMNEQGYSVNHSLRRTGNILNTYSLYAYQLS